MYTTINQNGKYEHNRNKSYQKENNIKWTKCDLFKKLLIDYYLIDQIKQINIAFKIINITYIHNYLK